MYIIFDKVAKNTQWERAVSPINSAGKTGSPMQKSEMGPHLTIFTKST